MGADSNRDIRTPAVTDAAWEIYDSHAFAWFSSR
jgi:hypothetical protein